MTWLISLDDLPKGSNSGSAHARAVARILEIGENQLHVMDDTDHFGPMGLRHDDITWSLSQKFIAFLHAYMVT